MPLIQEINKLHDRFDGVNVRDVSKDVRVLWSGVKIIMECRRRSDALYQDVIEQTSRLAAQLKTVEQTILHDAVTGAVPEPKVSPKLNLPVNRHARKKVRLDTDS
ncbi:hypothetical protein BWQ96_06073 [Gracilariopsis chorda]|uniref:Uncharacterized protein n=1 Tax=Gracilariopsis chorda TaxID=448386 RepID=A0A2V3IQ18_9FLOR|nr:hypothetical protein BWQ96_06073 [Gracilariopsis chorda]|eukprot:PXF44164.1 hypothetical protein BWQ96_06073 [Gracilariopsis chorda]